MFIGVMMSFIAIWLVNDSLLVEQCLDKGGSFNYRKGACLLENGNMQFSTLSDYLIAIYFFMGISIALTVSFTIRKIFKIKQ